MYIYIYKRKDILYFEKSFLRFLIFLKSGEIINIDQLKLINADMF